MMWTEAKLVVRLEHRRVFVEYTPPCILCRDFFRKLDVERSFAAPPVHPHATTRVDFTTELPLEQALQAVELGGVPGLAEMVKAVWQWR